MASGFLPREVNPFWFWTPSQWWIPSRSPEDTWQTWASSLSPVDCVSIPCRLSDRRGSHRCWSHNIQPGTRVEAHPGIFQKTIAHSLRVLREAGSVRSRLQCPALHPRVASQDPFDFTGSTCASASSLLRLSDERQWRVTAIVLREPSRDDRSTAGFAQLNHDRSYTLLCLSWVPQGTKTGCSVFHLRVSCSC